VPTGLAAEAALRHVVTFSALIVALALVSAAWAASPTAQYTVRFDATWSATTHPSGFPSNAHWSPLIGGTHDGSVSFWNVGQLASPGIRDMAELGRTTPLDLEVQARIAAGHAGVVIQGGGISPSPGTASASFTATQAFSRATVVSMIAPSPDWFVGVSGLDLVQGGEWRDLIVVPLFAFDAGTDSGTFYSAANQPTSPPDPIAPNPAPPFQNGTPLGIFTFTRVDAPTTAAMPASGTGASAALSILLGSIAIVALRRFQRDSSVTT
jgi:hypothetical protein